VSAITAEQIARVCHEANRGYQVAVPTPGIPVAPPWDEFPADQQAGIVLGVKAALEGRTPEQSHQGWIDHKVANGWVYGPVKDFKALTHPCLVPYDELPPEQKVKDSLFLAVVTTLARFSAEEPTP
jgi:hypothetical protein